MASLLELMEEQENKSKLQEDNTSCQTEELESVITIESLEAIIEMVEHDSLDSEEKTALIENIEEIFNTILEEAEVAFDEMECDETEDGCDMCGDCTDEDELDSHDGICNNCYNEKDEGLSEGNTLKRTTSAQRKKGAAYRRSADGKKALKLAAKKRKKYAKKISRCGTKGKTFSLKKMSCVKSKKRR